jgi:pyruvate/2-oxoglutarate/acetoin dehydrogenase E1 component
MRTVSYTQALREAIEEELRRDKDVFLMGEDIAEYGGAFGVTRDLVDKFGEDRILVET